MKIIIRIIVIVILLPVFSCNNKYFSISKRHHNPGYYTNWGKAKEKNAHKESLAEEKDISENSDPITAAAGNDLLLANKKESVVLNSAVTSFRVEEDENKKNEVLGKNKRPKLIEKINKKIKKLTPLKASANDAPIEPMGLAGFILWAASPLMSFLGAVSTIFPLFGFFFGVAGLILCLLSIQKHTREYGRYRGAIFPQIVLWVETISLFLGALIFLALAVLILAFSSAIGLGLGPIFAGIFIFFGLGFAFLGYLVLKLLLNYKKAKNGR